MQVVIRLDDQGLAAVELFASSEDEQHEAHRLYTAIQAEITALDKAVERFRGAIVGEEVVEVAGHAGR
jgi:hypothetical protein